MAMVWGRIVSAIKALIRQERADIMTVIPVTVDEYLGPVEYEGGGMELGTLVARCRVRPKNKKLMHDGREVELPLIFDVPVNWYKTGPVLWRFPFRRGQDALIVCAHRAIDKLLQERGVPKHPGHQRMHSLEDAILLPFGVRCVNDPLTPKEFLKDLYIAIVDENNDPISSFVMICEERPGFKLGEIRMAAPRISLISPEVMLGDYNVLDVIRRTVDKDNDSESNGPDIHPSGSKCVFAATRSRYKKGLTEHINASGYLEGAESAEESGQNVGG